MGRLTELFDAGNRKTLPDGKEREHLFNYISFDAETKGAIKDIRKKVKETNKI